MDNNYYLTLKKEIKDKAALVVYYERVKRVNPRDKNLLLVKEQLRVLRAKMKQLFKDSYTTPYDTN